MSRLELPQGGLQFIKTMVSRPFFVLLGGAGLAQLINLLSAPVLTRLYAPEAFGMLSLFATSLAVLGSVAGGRYEQAVIGESVDSFADRLVVLVALCSFGSVAILLILKPVIWPFFQIPAYISDVLVYLIPAVIAYCVGQALTNWLVRKGGFAITSSSKVIQAAIVLGASLCLVGLEQGLVVSSMIGYLAALLMLLLGARRMGWLTGAIRPMDLVGLLKRHRRFPLFGGLPALFDSLAALLPVYWVAIYFSASDTGQFGLSRQVLAAPIAMLSLVVSQILMKRLVDAKASRASMLPPLRRMILVMWGPILVFSVLISVAAPALFAWLFGEVWREAGSISRWMVWAYVAVMLVAPFSAVLLVLRKVALNGAWQTLRCVGLLILTSCIAYPTLENFVQALVVFEILAYAAYAGLIAFALYDYETGSRTQAG